MLPDSAFGRGLGLTVGNCVFGKDWKIPKAFSSLRQGLSLSPPAQSHFQFFTPMALMMYL